ncbi:MAG: NUDIX domain-containing protein [Gammaproteobacteria bacterium]|nr:MAG: NUDIX domain-containing protein [Gammaproteobacteria bacterium]
MADQLNFSRCCMNNKRHNVVAGVLIRDNRVLLCKRRDDLSWYPDVWDLVGGHVEPEENPEAALTRECREELGIEVTQFGAEQQFTTADMNLSVFVIKSWDGDIINAAPNEHHAIKWYAAAGLDGLALSDERLLPFLKSILAET